MSSHSDLEKLCSLAQDGGASGAAVLAAHMVVLDPRVRLKCMVPRCADYGRNLMCPPNVPSPEEFSQILKSYVHTIVVQYPMDAGVVQGFAGHTMKEIHQSDEYVKVMIVGKRAFDDLLTALEKEAMNLGYRFAAALSGGACHLCDECVGQGSGKPCRHPFRARPSMESMGIDVYQTAMNAGLPFEIPPKDHPVWTGLLLVD